MRRGRIWSMLVLVLVAGCAFDPSGLTGGDDVPPVHDGARPGRDGPAPDAAPPPCPLDPDLVACYRFEAALDPVQPHDDTSFGNHGVASNVTFVAGRSGRGTAIAFSDTASVVVPDSASLDVPTVITLEAWLLLDALPAAAQRMAVLDNNGQYGLFLSPTGQIRCAIGSTTAIGLAAQVGIWTHVACSYDGAIIRLYQDGVAGATIARTGPIPTAPTDGLGLGQNLPAPPADHLVGALDDVRIWRVALAPGEICRSAGSCR